MYNVIATGSKGNCEIYCSSLMVDIGVPYSKIKPYVKDVKIVILTHVHQDHLNMTTLRRLCFERPGIRIVAGEHIRSTLEGAKNVDICPIGQWFDYGWFKVSPVKLYHDCENVGWRIFVKQSNGDYFKIFRATDTSTLEGITALNYDLYAIESNYNEDTISEQIESNFYKRGAVNSHLSDQQARDFIDQNRGEHSQVLRLHESKSG